MAAALRRQKIIVLPLDLEDAGHPDKVKMEYVAVAEAVIDIGPSN
jgi:hypothetical protein